MKKKRAIEAVEL